MDDSQKQMLAGEEEFLERQDKFKNPCMSSMDRHSLILKSNKIPTIIMEEFGDTQESMIEEDDPRYYICTCNSDDMQMACTCKTAANGFNKAMFEKLTAQHAEITKNLQESIVALIEDGSFNLELCEELENDCIN